MNPKLAKRLHAIDGLRRAGEFDGAQRELRSALVKFPGTFELLLLAGQVHAARGAHQEAIASFERCNAIRPGRPEVWFGLGQSLYECHRFADAAEAFGREAACGGHPEAHQRRGVALQATGRLDEAITAYRAALVAGVDDYALHLNLGMCLYGTRRYQEALPHEQRALGLRPDDPVALYNLGSCALALGDLGQAIDWFGRSRLPEAASAALYARHFVPDTAPGELADAHRAWGRQIEQAVRPPPGASHDGPPNPRLRVGYLSGDLRAHPVMYFLAPLLAHHDRDRFEIFCYADVAAPDEHTGRARALSEHWRDIAGHGDEDAAAAISRDRIDVLVDLGGHTGSRMRLMAMRPAPVQVSYLGYASTTGLASIGYRLTDAHLDPPGSEGDYTEQLVALRPTCYAYAPPPDAPAPAPPPHADGSALRFGVVSRAHKINAASLDLWAAVLTACADTTLTLVASHLNEPQACAALREAFAARDIDADRITLQAALPLADYLAYHRHFDLILDALPWAGHTNTLHAAWMGVPTLTLRGRLPCGRFGAMVMAHLGLDAFVAADREDFVRRAQDFSRDPAPLAELRTGLRERLRRSVLCDAAAVTAAVEKAYWEMAGRAAIGPR